MSLLWAAGCAGSPGPVPLDDAAPAPAGGTSSPAAAAAPAADPTAEVRALWEQVLAVFAAGPGEREVRLAPVAARAPADLAATADAFVPAVARTLTSRATYRASGGDLVTITDCASSSARSLLGDSTAGFRAEAVRADPGAAWAIRSVTLVPNCVPRADAEAALAAYEAFHAGEARLWATLDPADPALRLVTATEKASLLANFGEHRTYGWREIRGYTRQTVEAVGTRADGAVLLVLCTTYSADTGVYDQKDQLVPGSGRPGQWHLQAAMVRQEGQWLFDGYTNTGQGCSFAPTGQAAALL